MICRIFIQRVLLHERSEYECACEYLCEYECACEYLCEYEYACELCEYEYEYEYTCIYGGLSSAFCPFFFLSHATQ